MPGVEIVAIADPRLAAAQALSDEVGGTATKDGLAVASMSDIDGLVIASPEDTHEPLVHAALTKRTHILCEKPLAVGSDACQRIVDAEISLGRRLLQLGLMRVYDPAHVQLAAAAASLGELHHVRCVHRNRHEVRRTAQLVLNQSLVHDIHSLRWLVGRQISRVTTIVTPNPDHVEHLLMTAEFDGGGHAVIEFSEHSFFYEVTVEVEGELGGAQTRGILPLAVRRAEHGHFSPQRLPELHGHVPQSPETDHGQPVARSHAPVLEWGVGGNAGTEERGGAGRRERFRDP